MADVLNQDPTQQDHQLQSDFSPIQLVAKEGLEAYDKQKKIIDELVPIFVKWQNWRQAYERIWEEIYRLYFSNQDKYKTPTRSAITVPIIFQVIEAAVPKIVNTIFGSGEEFFDLVATDPNDDAFAVQIKMLLTYQLTQADFMIKFVDFVKQLLLYGTSYFYVYWKVKREWVFSREPIRETPTINGFSLGEQIRWEEKREYKVVERRPEIDVLDILDVFPDPESRNEKDARGMFVRSWIPLSDVKEMGKGSYPVFANTENQALVSDDHNYAASRQIRSTIRGVSNISSGDKELVEVLTYWGYYDLDGDGIKEKVQIVIGNRNVLFVARQNPFHHQQSPVIRCVFFPVPLEWYGLGLVEPVISNVHELWTLRRQRLDNINLVINRMWKVNSLADVDLDTLVSTPNGIVLTDQMDGVIPLETNDVTSNAYTEAAIVQTDIENATAPRSIQGSPENGKLGRTAKGAQLIIGQALEKFAVGTKLVEELGIKRVLRLVHALNLQFIDDDEMLNQTYGVIFPEPMRVEQLRTDIRFKMIGISDMVGTEGKVNQLTSFLGIGAQFLDPLSVESILKKIYELMGFNKDEIRLVGMANPQGQVAPQIMQSILGQAGNQGTQAGPPQIPTQG